VSEPKTWPGAPAEAGGGATPPRLPPVAGDIRELLAATEDGVDVPAEGGFPAVRLIAPSLEALRPVYAHLDLDSADVPPPETNGTGPVKGKGRGKRGAKAAQVNPERFGSLMTKTISLRVAVLKAVMPGLDDGPYTVRLADRLGTEALIIREAFRLCMLPLSLLGGDDGAEGEAAEAGTKASFPARPTR